MTQPRTKRDEQPSTKAVTVTIPRSERERAGLVRVRDRTGAVVRLGGAQLAEHGIGDKAIAEFFGREATRVKVAGFVKRPERGTLELPYEPAPSDRGEA